MNWTRSAGLYVLTGCVFAWAYGNDSFAGVPANAAEMPTLAACGALAVAHAVVSSDGFTGEQFDWRDASCLPRTALMVYDDRTDPAGHKGGYLRSYDYQLSDASTRHVVGSLAAHPGWGYTANTWDTNFTVGMNSLGTWQLLFVGRHHAILRFVRTISIGGPVQTTVDWFFATGKDHPVWAVTFDASAAQANAILADTRSPYGDLAWDGGVNATVDGVGWGDHYKFRTTTTPESFQSGWDYTTPNIVPYVQMWANAVDAEMGAVQTQTMNQHDAGRGSFYSAWGTAQAAGPMPPDYNWTFQLNQYELPFVSTSKRMAWGSNYGAIGQNSYYAYGDSMQLDGYPYQSYAVYMVLGQHSSNATQAQVTQVERQQGLALTASVGSVKTNGPAGVALPDSAIWAPAGYNPAYGTFELVADANTVHVTLAPNSGVVRNPIVVIDNFTAPAARIEYDGNLAIADVDYFASLDAVNQRLWLTLRRDVASALALSVSSDRIFSDGFD